MPDEAGLALVGGQSDGFDGVDLVWAEQDDALSRLIHDGILPYHLVGRRDGQDGFGEVQIVRYEFVLLIQPAREEPGV